MATTAVSSTSTSSAAATTLTSAASAQALNKANAQKIITALGAGSGVDVAALAQGLVDAERVPQENLINTKITANEGRVSGYAAVSFMLKSMNDALTALKDANSFNASSVSNSNTAAMDVTTATGAVAGSHSVSISSLASAQRNISAGFASSTTSLNAGSGFTMGLTMGSAAAATMAGATSTSKAAVSGLTINGTAIDAVSADPTVVTTSGYSTATPTKVLSAGDGSSYSTIAVTFSALAAGQSATLNGLTFTASAAMDASAVGNAFAGLAAAATTGPSTSLGSYTGTFGSDWTSGTNSSGVVTLTAAALGTTTDTTGTTSSTAQSESSVVTFSALAAGQKATVNGLTFTATAAMTAEQVASAFGGLTSGDTDGNTTGAALGTYSGTFAAGFSTGVVSGATVTATSDTSANVTDIAITARKFDNLAIAINAKTSTTGVSAVNTSGSVALSGGHITLGTTTNSTAAITGISGTVVSSAVTVTVAAGNDTPQGLVNAINSAGLAVTAQLVNTGSSTSPSYKVVLSGATGSAGAFNLSTAPDSVLSTLGFTQTAAADAVLNVDGVTYNRSSNSVTDVINGVTLNLHSTTTTAASVTLTRDTAQIKTNITALVTAYNDATNILNEVSNAKSTLPTYGATLVGDSMVRQIRTQLRGMMVGTSSSPGTNVGALWQMGISVDSKGVMAVDSTKLDTALTTNFADVVTTFTGNQNGRTATSPPYSTSGGFASATSPINGGAAFSLSLVTSTGTFGVPISAASTTPQGVVDAINASNQGFTAQLVQDSTGATPYKIMVMGSLGSSGFTLTSQSTAGTAVTGMGFSNNGAGVAGDALRKIAALLSPTGGLITQSAGATTQNDKLKVKLADLQTRMTALLARYTTQFSAMESMIGNITTQKASLKSSTDGMMAMYTNK